MPDLFIYTRDMHTKEFFFFVLHYFFTVEIDFHIFFRSHTFRIIKFTKSHKLLPLHVFSNLNKYSIESSRPISPSSILSTNNSNDVFPISPFLCLSNEFFI